MPAKKKSKAGRKKIDPALKKLSGSIAMTESQWEALDEQRGELPRGEHIAKKLKLGRKKP